MKCPKCNLVNSDFVEACDCGYRLGIINNRPEFTGSSNSRASKVGFKIAQIAGTIALAITALVFAAIMKKWVTGESEGERRNRTSAAINSSAGLNKSSVSAGDPQLMNEVDYEKMLKLLEVELNTEMPLTVDQYSRVERVTTGPGKKITYFVKFIDLDADTANVNEIRKELTPQVRLNICTSPDMENFRTYNVIISYEYSDKLGRPLLGISINPKLDCA